MPVPQANPFYKRIASDLDGARGMDGPEAARKLCHPMSPLAGDPAVLAKVLAYLDEHLDVWHKDDLPSRIEHNWTPDEMSREDFIEGERFFFEQELLPSHLESNITIQCLDDIETEVA